MFSVSRSAAAGTTGPGVTHDEGTFWVTICTHRGRISCISPVCRS